MIANQTKPHHRRQPRLRHRTVRPTGIMILDLMVVLTIAVTILSTIGFCLLTLHRVYAQWVTEISMMRSTTIVIAQLRTDVHNAQGAIYQVESDPTTIVIPALDGTIRYAIVADTIVRTQSNAASAPETPSSPKAPTTSPVPTSQRWQLILASSLAWQVDQHPTQVQLKITGPAGIETLLAAGPAGDS